MLRRLVQLEPELFRDLRGEIWDEIRVIERRFFENNIHHHRNRKLFLLLVSSINKIWREFTMMLRRPYHNSKYYNPSNQSNHEQQRQQPISIPLSPQPGQNPTVFFLRRLEAIPLHNIIETATTCTHKSCPCIRLWKELPKPSNTIPSALKLTGDINALQQSFVPIRDELLSLVMNTTYETNTALFQPFHSAVYEHANNNSGTTNNKQQAEWSSIYLYHQGIKQVQTCQTLFPITTNILETQCPHLIKRCGFGSVYFSKLKPNTRVVEHCGPTNVRLRCHLPLLVPNVSGSSSSSSSSKASLLRGSKSSYLQVDKYCISWEEGKPILFDDSFTHSAVYVGGRDDDDFENSEGTTSSRSRSRSSSSSSSSSSEQLGHNEDRIVLVVDFWHPALSESDRTALGVLYPPGGS